MEGAAAVVGEIRERRALDGLATGGAGHRRRVDKQELVFGVGARTGEDTEQPLDGVGEATATLDVAGLAGQARERIHEPPTCDREEPAVRRDAHDRRGLAERDHCGIREPTPGVLPRLWQEIIGCATNDRAESVEVGVHRGPQADGVIGTVGFGASASLFLHTVGFVASTI
jgi:hypothetical protein